MWKDNHNAYDRRAIEHHRAGILVGKRKIADLGPKGSDISLEFPSIGLCLIMKVYVNTRFRLRLRRVPDDNHKARVMSAAVPDERWPPLKRRGAGRLKGQQQRVYLASTKVHQPNSFPMDVPLSNPEAKLRVSTRAHIKHLHHTPRTKSFYVSNDQIEATTPAVRFVMIHRSEVQKITTPGEIADRTANTVVATHTGKRAFDKITGEVQESHIIAPNVRPAGPHEDVNCAVVLGVPAEDAGISVRAEVTAPVNTLEVSNRALLIAVLNG